MSSTDQGNRSNTVFIGDRGDTLHVRSGGAVEVESGASIDIESGGTLEFSGTALTLSAAEANSLDLSVATLGVPRTAAVSFTEASAGTSYTGTIAIPASSLVWDIQFRSTVLWDGTSAALDVGDDDDPNGYFAGINLKATDLEVGEVLSITNSENWGGKQGVYLVAATGLKSATYYATANNIIGLVTPGAADGTAGRSFMHVIYSTIIPVASTNV